MHTMLDLLQELSMTLLTMVCVGRRGVRGREGGGRGVGQEGVGQEGRKGRQ